MLGQKWLVKVDTNKMLIQNRLQMSPSVCGQPGGASRFPQHVPVSVPVAAGIQADASEPTEKTQPSHWTGFVCSMHAIHLLIWIYANVAVVPRQRRLLAPWLSTLVSYSSFPLFWLFVFLWCLLRSVGTVVGTSQGRRDSNNIRDSGRETYSISFIHWRKNV